MGDFSRLADLLLTNDLDTALRLLDARGTLSLKDGITAPPTPQNDAILYVDTSDGDLKVKFSDGTVKTVVVDT